MGEEADFAAALFAYREIAVGFVIAVKERVVIWGRSGVLLGMSYVASVSIDLD